MPQIFHSLSPESSQTSLISVKQLIPTWLREPFRVNPIRRPHHDEVMVEKHRGVHVQSFYQLAGFDGLLGNAIGKVRKECLVFKAFVYLFGVVRYIGGVFFFCFC